MHNASAIIFICIDWRLHPRVEKLFARRYGSFDLCATAGSVKGFTDQKTKTYFLGQIAIAKKLHHIKTAALSMHRDCGAYGESAAFKSSDDEAKHHAMQLRETRRIIKRHFPRLKVELYFIDLASRSGKWAPTLQQMR